MKRHTFGVPSSCVPRPTKALTTFACFHRFPSHTCGIWLYLFWTVFYTSDPVPIVSRAIAK